MQLRELMGLFDKLSLFSISESCPRIFTTLGKVVGFQASPSRAQSSPVRGYELNTVVLTGFNNPRISDLSERRSRSMILRNSVGAASA